MSGYQPQFVVHFQRAVRVHHHTMLVRAFHVLDIISAKDHRKARVYGLRLKPGIHNRLVRLCVAHHRGQNEERVFPLALIDPFAIFVEDAAIIRVHKRV